MEKANREGGHRNLGSGDLEFDRNCEGQLLHSIEKCNTVLAPEKAVSLYIISPGKKYCLRQQIRGDGDSKHVPQKTA